MIDAETGPDEPLVASATAERAAQRDRQLELLTVFLLGLAAMATAWAAFQASSFDGKVVEGFTDANLSLSDANAYYNAGDQIYAGDQMLFLEYEQALNDEDEEYAVFIKDSLMRDELIAAIDWWEQPENFDTY